MEDARINGNTTVAVWNSLQVINAKGCITAMWDENTGSQTVTHTNVSCCSQARIVNERAMCLLLLPEVSPLQQSTIQLLSKWSVTSVTPTEL